MNDATMRTLFLASAGFYALGLLGQTDEKWKADALPTEQGPVVFDETRGNWYYKRRYYKDARELYQKTRKRVDEVDKLKGVFFQKRTTIDASVSQFNLELGFEQGELDELLNNLIGSLSQEREKMIELTEEERKLNQQLKDKKAAVEGLKKDLSLVTQIDNALDKAMAQVLENIGEARSYEEKAWQNYNNIAAEINDKKAEEYLLQMKSYFDNIDSTANYLTNQLMPFFDTKIEELQSHMDTVRDRVASLKAQGVQLSKKVAEDEKADAQRLAEKKKREAEAAVRKGAQGQAGWWQSIKDFFSSAYSWMSEKIAGIFVSKPAEAVKTSRTPEKDIKKEVKK
jgi:chromosome segregation ATPase